VWREPLVWAAADTFDLVPGAALPLALYRELGPPFRAIPVNETAEWAVTDRW
jgi:hypothetical protein